MLHYRLKCGKNVSTADNQQERLNMSNVSKQALEEKRISAIALLAAINNNADESTLTEFERKTDEVIKEMKAQQKERENS